MKTETKTIAIRIPTADLEEIKNVFWAAAPEHKTSFNSWIIAAIKKGSAS
mgnify:CR=1 FL=1